MRNFSAALVLFFISFSTIGQVGQLGLSLGGSYYLGDLNLEKHFYKTKFSGGLVYKYNTRGERLVFRLHLNYLRVEANDADSKYLQHNLRNLNFKSSIIEIGPAVELNFYKFQIGTRTNMGNRNRKSATPYIFIGLNYFRMNPQGTGSNGDWIELQSIGTEGQSTTGENKPYKQNQFSVPVGLGYKFNLSPRLSASIEYGLRKTFTDYLDDVSTVYANPVDLSPIAQDLSNKTTTDVSVIAGTQRGNPNVKDWYVFSGITISYRLKRATSCTH